MSWWIAVPEDPSHHLQGQRGQPQWTRKDDPWSTPQQEASTKRDREKMT